MNGASLLAALIVTISALSATDLAGQPVRDSIAESWPEWSPPHVVTASTVPADGLTDQIMPIPQTEDSCRRALSIGMVAGAVLGTGLLYLDERANPSRPDTQPTEDLVFGALTGFLGFAIAGVFFCAQ